MTAAALRPALAKALDERAPAGFARGIGERIAAGDWRRHGDLERWRRAVSALPLQPDAPRELDRRAPILGRPLDDACAQTQIVDALRELVPWRKGPLVLYGETIDTEWASDRKWARIRPALGDLADQRILDVGCGNGYFALRAAGAGAAAVLGIDPSVLFVQQFAAAARALGDEAIDVVALPLEALDGCPGRFDQVWSMGVLYHRRSPFDHLERLKAQLVPGGRLILETLVVAGDANTVLVPEARYARMRNVWFVPSLDALTGWLRRSRFVECEVVDVSPTTTDEQRTTDWMPFESLAEALDPADTARTIEGYPAPCRAVVAARCR